MSQLQVTGEAKIRDIQGPVVANSGVITALDGAASQYVRGDGTLADFPTSTGGGSSVSYYLNSSVSQGTIGGVAYRELSKEPIIGAGTDITISANGYVASYITDANDPDVLSVPGGNFNCEFYFSVNNNTGNPTTYAELYKYDGTTFTLLGSSQAVPESLNQGTTIAPYYFAIPVATAALALTDRLAIRIYVNVDGRVVTLHTENSHLCQVVTTFSKGMVSLNNLTDQSQFITTGTSGTDFNIVSSGDTHTFNLPIASATNTGKLSSTDWSTFNNKQAALSFTAPLVNTSNTISIPAATSLVDGYLDNLDWVNFNTAYNDSIISAAVTGTTTKTLTLNQQDGGTITASWTDINTDAVTSVFGRTGAVVAQSGDYTTTQVTEGTNLYYTDARSRGALSFTAGSGAYNSTTGVITIPTNNNQITNGAGYITSSALTSYVPYTGATTNVDLGTNSISSSFIYGNGVSGLAGSIYLKQTTSIQDSSSGYSSMSAFGASSLHFSLNNGTLNRRFRINSVNLDGTNIRTYLLPDADGTIALTSDLSAYVTLATTQTISGLKTFDAAISANYGIALLNGAIPPLTSIYYAALSGNSTGLSITYRTGGGTNYTNNLNFPANNNSYLFPSASGTLALTSDLGAYLPLTGGTLTGALNGTSASFSSSVTATELNLTGNAAIQNTTTGGYLALYGNTGGMYLGAYNAGANQNYMRITPTGNVGIGTNSPTSYSGFTTLNINNATNGGIIDLLNNGTRVATFFNTSTDVNFGSITNVPLLFYTNNAERMRLTSGGNLLLGTTSDPGYGRTTASVYAATGGIMQVAGSSTTALFYVYQPNNTAYIGTTTNHDFAVISNNATRLTISSTGAATFSSSVTATNGIFSGEVYNTTTGAFFIANAIGNTSYPTYGFYNNVGVGMYRPSADVLGFVTSSTERMRITSGGQIGIGTSSPTARLSIANSACIVDITSTTSTSFNGLEFKNGGGSFYLGQDNSGGGFYGGSAYAGSIYTSGAIPIILFTNATERMRITSGGDVTIGDTSASANLWVKNSGAGNTFGARNTNASFAATVGFFGADRNTTNNSFYYIDCYNYGSGTYRFRVADSGNVTNTNNSYGAISDIKLKENITNATPKLDDLLKVQIRNFNYIGSDEKQIGVIAQELEQVFPSMVDETIDKDANGKDLGTKTKSVKYSVFVPMLIKAMQEQNQLITELEARIKQLENK